MVWHSDDFAEQFVINGITQFIECGEVGCTKSVAPGSFRNRVDAGMLNYAGNAGDLVIDTATAGRRAYRRRLAV